MLLHEFTCTCTNRHLIVQVCYNQQYIHMCDSHNLTDSCETNSGMNTDV